MGRGSRSRFAGVSPELREWALKEALWREIAPFLERLADACRKLCRDPRAETPDLDAWLQPDAQELWRGYL